MSKSRGPVFAFGFAAAGRDQRSEDRKLQEDQTLRRAEGEMAYPSILSPHLLTFSTSHFATATSDR